MIPYVTRTSKAGLPLGSYGLEGVDRKNALPIDAHAERVYVVEGVTVFEESETIARNPGSGKASKMTSSC